MGLRLMATHISSHCDYSLVKKSISSQGTNLNHKSAAQIKRLFSPFKNYCGCNKPQNSFSLFVLFVHVAMHSKNCNYYFNIPNFPPFSWWKPHGLCVKHFMGMIQIFFVKPGTLVLQNKELYSNSLENFSRTNNINIYPLLFYYQIQY